MLALVGIKDVCLPQQPKFIHPSVTSTKLGHFVNNKLKSEEEEQSQVLSPSSWNGSSTTFDYPEPNNGAVSQLIVNTMELEGVLSLREPVKIEE